MYPDRRRGSRVAEKVYDETLALSDYFLVAGHDMWMVDCWALHLVSHPHFTFNDGLLVSACVTATDPVLAAAVVGKGKFAERVPGHLRNLLSAESGCNDGMAFPFIFLSLNLIIHSGHAGEIVKDWFC